MSAGHKPRVPNALVGSPVERIEDLAFCAGAASSSTISRATTFSMPRSCAARGARPHPLDRASAALARPGVHRGHHRGRDRRAMPTIPLRQESSPAFQPFEQPVIAHDKVRYVGEPIALVLAKSAAAAEDALEAIALDIEPLPAVVDSAAAAMNGVLLFEAAGQQSRAHAARRARRRRGRFRAARLTSGASVSCAAPYRGADGAARARGRMGRGARAADRVRRGQGGVSQSARARRSRWICRKAPFAWSRTTSAAASAPAANTIPRIS